VDVASVDLDDEENVDPAQCHGAVDVEEVAGQYRRSLSLQELPPAQVGVSGRRWRYPQPSKDPSDCRGADAMADLEQLALDPLVAPARILPGGLSDQVGQRSVYRRSTLAMRVTPMLGYQLPVPAQQRSGRNESMAADGGWESSRANAAKTARLFQFNPGFGLVLRSTSSSWRRTSSSASLEADERASNTIQASSREKIK
jgi:hypothetical protein